MKISVLGCGRWGSFIAWYLDKIGHDVTLYGREGSESFLRIKNTRQNDYLSFSDTLALTTNLEDACSADVIVISVGAQNLRSVLKQIRELGVKNKTFVLCMKGIETETGKRLSEVTNDEFITSYDPNSKVAVWLGPGHVQDFAKGVPGCMVIDSSDKSVRDYLVNEFSSKLIRFYYGDDLIGNEIGAAIKNVIGIAAGIIDGLGMTALKGALTTRGAYEVSRLIKALGGKSFSAYGLCHLGDYAATVFSEYSQNRMFGEAYAKGDNYTKLAEGYYTVVPVVELSRKLDVAMPICKAVYDVLYNKYPVDTAISELLERELKPEYWNGH